MSLKHRHLVFTYPFTVGLRNGATRNLFETAVRLTQRGIKVSIVAVARPYDAGDQFAFTNHPRPGTSLLRVYTVPPRPRLHFYDSRPVRETVAQILAQDPADAVLGHYYESALLPALAKKHRAIFGFVSLWQSYRVALAQRSESLNWRQRLRTCFWKRWRVVRSHRRAQILFASSHFTKTELVDVMGVDAGRVVVNHLGVDEQFLAVPRPRPEAITRILFFGRLVRTKGVVDALEALATIARGGNRRWQYRMCSPKHDTGNEKSHQWVQGLIREKGLADLVVVRPAGGEELRQELERAHLALMPSHVEAFGLSIAEAQAAGLPVVAYAAGSVPEIVQHGITGWLAPAHDVSQLTRHLAHALANPQVAYERGMAGRRRIATHFTWERTVSTLVEHLEQLQS